MFAYSYLTVGLLSLACLLQCQTNPPQVTQGQGKFSVVSLSDLPSFYERHANGRMTIPTGNDYEVRETSGKKELLIAFVTGTGIWAEKYGKSPADDWYNDNFYAISLDGQFRVRPATRQQWNAAKRISHYRMGLSRSIETHSTNEVSYRDKTFAKSGESWTLDKTDFALPSENGKWIAVFSYTGTKNPGRLLSPSGSNQFQDATSGEIYVDIYDTSSGARIMAGHAPYGGATPRFFYSGSFWVEDRYFVMPLDSAGDWNDGDGNLFFIGIMPDK